MSSTPGSIRSTGIDGWSWLFLVLGVGALANAVWMLVDPLRWYHDLPAGVPDFGEFNPHFVRDIGCAFASSGAALVWAAFSRRFRLPLVAVATMFFVAHAVLHVYDTSRGAVDAHHWWLDLPGVYLPALLLVLATAALLRRDGGTDAT
jgi:hypothetical protein